MIKGIMLSFFPVKRVMIPDENIIIRVNKDDTKIAPATGR
jgi:hypothetical protein